MPFNLPGTLVPFQLLFAPRLAVPGLAVRDIRQLDFFELKRAGYRGAIFDKDNCLTIPHKDELVPELEEAWRECRQIFGEGNVLIVSNSAGTRLDPAGVQAESVSHHLKTPVLRHAQYKPGYACIKGIRGYFGSLNEPVKDEELIVVGDRVFTDVVLSGRMARRVNEPKALESQESKLGEEGLEKVSLEKPSTEITERAGRVGPLSIWTTGVWKRESMAMRYLERQLVEAVRRWVAPTNGVKVLGGGDVSRFVKPDPIVSNTPSLRKVGVWEKAWRRIRPSSSA